MPVRKTRLGPGTLTIGGDNSPQSLESQVTKCALEPSVSTDDPREVLSGEMIAGDRTESWKLSGTIIDDFGTAGSIVEWLFTNRGKEMDFAFTPSTAGATKVRGRLVVEAVAIGGDVAKVNDLDFEFIVLNPALAAVGS